MLSLIGNTITLITKKLACLTENNGNGVKNAMHGCHILLYSVVILMAQAFKGHTTLEITITQAVPPSLI